MGQAGGPEPAARTTKPLRGLDTSVSTPTQEEERAARAAFKVIQNTPPRKGEYTELDLDLYNPKAPLVKFAVYSDKGNESGVLSCIGSKPWYRPDVFPTGPGTRTFAVYVIQLDRIVFMKDTWRVDLPGIKREGETYQLLHEKGVPYIADFIRGGDIPSQRTITHCFEARTDEEDKLLKAMLRPYAHYRLLLGEIGTELTKFKSSWEVVNALKNALEGRGYILPFLEVGANFIYSSQMCI